MDINDVEKQYSAEKKVLKKLEKKNIAVDMTRGKPCGAQLEIAMPMLQNAAECVYEVEGGDARNYGDPAGIRPARELFAQLFGVSADEVYVSDGSSLELMYTLVQFAMDFGVLGGVPWKKLPRIKFVCPAPGYDRHFAICKAFGIDMVTVPMLSDGPDMDLVENLVNADQSVKGMWCVPKYSNPTGIVFSDKVVQRIAALKPAAADFRVFWDNAYMVHSLYDADEKLKNIFECARKCGNEDMIYSFTSTSKITFAGSGIAAFAADKRNIDDFMAHQGIKKINSNKVNQVLHVNFLKDKENIYKIMAQHADILRPKFELVEGILAEAFGDDDRVRWTTPKGGYFISLDVPGCAKRIVQIASGAGVKFTAAGATYPYGLDDADSNIRIAPSVPAPEELEHAISVLVSAIRLALYEKELAAHKDEQA